VLALTLNFPLNALAKQEDDNLQTTDACCSEVLLPRLKDTAASLTIDSSAVANSIAIAIAGSQERFINGLDQLAKHMTAYAAEMEQRMTAFQQTLNHEIAVKNEEMRTQNQEALKDSLDQVSKYLGGLESGIGGLNKVLTEFGEKQIVIYQPSKKRWFWSK